MAKTFTAQLEQFKGLTTANMRKVAAGAIQDVLEAAQTPQQGITAGGSGFVTGKIPVATSELINSLTVEGVTGPAAYVTAIAGMQIGDVMRFAWTAPHAMPMEVGFTTANGREVPGRFFVSQNAAKFSEFVAAQAAKVRK